MSQRWCVQAIGDIEVLRRQAGVPGPVASASTVGRSLDEVSGTRSKKIEDSCTSQPG